MQSKTSDRVAISEPVSRTGLSNTHIVISGLIKTLQQSTMKSPRYD